MKYKRASCKKVKRRGGGVIIVAICGYKKRRRRKGILRERIYVGEVVGKQAIGLPLAV